MSYDRVFKLTDDGGACTGGASVRQRWMSANMGIVGEPQTLFAIESIRAVLAPKAKARLKFEPTLHVRLNARLIFAAPLFSCEAAWPIHFAVASNDEVHIMVLGSEGPAPDVAVHFSVASERVLP